ncbi:MAG TPA: tubulin-like doman-containing protein [Allocoleopsis sp.]
MVNSSLRSTVVFRPTVVIGLGGTGYHCLLKLKKRFEDVYGKLPPIIQLLSIDTTENAQRREQTSEGHCVSLSPSEMYQISVTNPGQIVKLNPHISSWWPTTVNANLPIDKGAGQVRARGRLGVFVKNDDIFSLIQQAVNSVRDIKNNAQAYADQFQVSNTGNVEIFIVGSLAGGTGSGTFLDIAFLARNRDPHISITGMLALPRVFVGKPFTELVQSNTYGALKEIEHFWHPEPMEINYGTRTIEVTRSPFDLLFLVDSVNEIGKVISDPSDLQELMADGLYTQIGSQIGVDNANAADNIKAMLSERKVFRNRYRVSYCSFGFASLALSVQQYEKMQLEDALRLLNNDLLGGATSTNLEPEIKTFLERNKLDEGQLLDALGERAEGGKLSFKMSLGGFSFSTGADRRIKEQYQRHFNSMEMQVSQRLSTNFAELQQKILAGLQEEWMRRSGRGNGLDASKQFLQALQSKLTENHRRFQEKSQELQRQLKTIKLEDREAKIQEALKAFVGKEKKVEAACQNYINLVNQQCQIYVNQKCYDRAVELFGALCSQLERLLQQHDQIRSSLKKVCQQIDFRLNQVSGSKDGTFVHTLQRFDVSANKPQISQEGFAQWQHEQGRGIFDWATMTAQEIQTEIEQFIRESYQSITRMSIEEVLNNSDPELVSQDLAQLWNLAHPLWRYDTGKIPAEDVGTIHESCYYGTYDGANTVLRDPKFASRLSRSRTEPSFVSTSDPHRITLFRVKVGVPLFALYGMEDMEFAYKDTGRSFKHLHKDWESFPNLLPSDENEEAIGWFALGLAFKLIDRRLGHYCLDFQKNGARTAQEIRLGKGRVEAFNEFKSKKNQEVVLATQKKVEAFVQQMHNDGGDAKVAATLKHHIDALDKQLTQSSEISSELRQQVEAEIQAIDQFMKQISDVLF